MCSNEDDLDSTVTLSYLIYGRDISKAERVIKTTVDVPTLSTGDCSKRVRHRRNYLSHQRRRFSIEVTSTS